jgi:prepilin-type N-terminal cleavage/methylation domain-containing protein
MSREIGVRDASHNSLIGHEPPQRAFSLTELMAVIAVLAVVAGIILPRLTTGSNTSKKAACEAIQGDIEVQSELWRHNTGSWPATNLSNIGADVNYFPEGLPVCPYDGTAYTIDATGRVVGHNH